MQKDEKSVQITINWYEKSESRSYFIDLNINERIYVDRETYLDYKRPEWREWRQNLRNSRCQIPSKNGGLKRCDQDCSQCPFFRNGRTLSLDQLYEDYAYEVADESSNIIQNLINKEKEELIRDAINELDPINKTIIIKTFYEEMSQTQIAKILGISQNAVSKRYKKSLEQLKESLSKYFD